MSATLTPTLARPILSGSGAGHEKKKDDATASSLHTEGIVKPYSNPYGIKTTVTNDYLHQLHEKKKPLSMQINKMSILDSDTAFIRTGVLEYDTKTLATNEYFEQYEEDRRREQAQQAEQREAAYEDSKREDDCASAPNSSKKCLVFLYCRTEEGHSVCLWRAYSPYIYLQPENENFTSREVTELCRRVAARLKVSPELVTAKREMRKRFDEFFPDPKDPTKAREFPMIKLSVPTANAYGYLPHILGTSMVLHSKTFRYRLHHVGRPFEPKTCFHYDTGITEGAWIDVPIANLRAPSRYVSHTQLEATVDEWRSVKPDPTNGNMAPFLICDSDVECHSTKGDFPQYAERKDDAIISIAANFAYRGSSEIQQTVVFVNNRKSLPPTDPKCIVVNCRDEIDLQERYRDCIALHSDPDLEEGYNNHKFDDHCRWSRYLMNHREGQYPGRFPYMSRFIHEQSELKANKFKSNQSGSKESNYIYSSGRHNVDLYTFVSREFRLRSYKLGYVAQKFLGRTKHDMPPKEMFRIFGAGDDADPAEMAALIDYNKEDARLTHGLGKRLSHYDSMYSTSFVTGTAVDDLNIRGQQIRIFNILAKVIQEQGYVMSYPDDYVKPKYQKSEKTKASAGKKKAAYQGAFVLTAQQGFYEGPVFTLDFESLYPSIMKSYNICPSTHVKDPSHLNLPGLKYSKINITKTEAQHYVTNFPSVTSIVVQKLLAERKRLKNLMKTAVGDAKEVFNQRQKAVKVSCNSIYGFYGAQQGIYPHKQSAASVTGQGRDNLIATKEIIEAYEFTRVEISPDGLTYKERPDLPKVKAKVIYGDTDSCMGNFEDLPRRCPAALLVAWDRSEFLATYVTEKLERRVNLQPEKIMMPYLLTNKKRYAGGLYKDRDYNQVEIIIAGLETVRRDNTIWFSEMQKAVLEQLVIKVDPVGAYNIILNEFQSLLQGKVPIERLTVSKALNSAYKGDREKMIPVIISERLESREPGSGYKPGERVPYVVIVTPESRSVKSQIPLYQRVEDPDYAKQHNLQLDYFEYLRQAKTSLEHIFSFFPEEYSLEKLLDVALDKAACQRAGKFKSLFGETNEDRNSLSHLSKKRKDPDLTPTESSQLKKKPLRQKTLFGGIADVQQQPAQKKRRVAKVFR